MTEEMKPLSKITGALVGRFVKKSPPPSIPNKPPQPPLPPFDGLRFYIAKSKLSTAVSLVWVDHDENCYNHHETQDDQSWRKSDWHSHSGYDDYHKRWYPYAIRCPMSISVGFLLETNSPPGHAESRLASERKYANDRQKSRGVTEGDME